MKYRIIQLAPNSFTVQFTHNHIRSFGWLWQEIYYPGDFPIRLNSIEACEKFIQEYRYKQENFPKVIKEVE